MIIVIIGSINIFHKYNDIYVKNINIMTFM